jgi:hypothetical protein
MWPASSYEVRMRAAPQTCAVKQPLFIIDLFDHDAQLLMDSRACYDLTEGATAFDALVSR